MMRRSSSRRTSSGVVPAAATASAGTGNKAAAKEQERIDTIFSQYADKNEELSIGAVRPTLLLEQSRLVSIWWGNCTLIIHLKALDTPFSQRHKRMVGSLKFADPLYNESLLYLCRPEGVEALCQDLAVLPTDIQVLLLAWKLQAARQGYFSLEEWRKGLKAMRVDSLEKLKKALPGLQQEVANQYTFKEFYTFSFQYCLTEPRQKTLDLETASQMLDLVLGPRPHLALFVRFLQAQTEYKAMNLDQWTAFLRFCDEVRPDLSNYDESQAWPLLLDNFVDWARKGWNSS